MPTVDMTPVSDVTYTSEVTTEHDVIYAVNARNLHGRRIATVPYTEITRENVVSALALTEPVYKKNAAEIDYLYKYYCGDQTILGKTKEVRPETNNIVLVNRANEIVTFKTAYLLNEPLQYISHGADDGVSEQVNRLNELMRMEDKSSQDKEIVDWMHIAGVGVRFVYPDPDYEQDGAPFYIATLDPRTAYVIYGGSIRKKAIAGVIHIKDEDGNPFVYVYTQSTRFTVKDGTVTDEEPFPDLTRPPVIEYAANMPRLGAFEIVILILDAINRLESDSVDNVQDFVNAFDVFHNCEIGEAYKDLNSGGKAIEIKTTVPGMDAKVYRVTSEINQGGVQTRIDDLTSSYLEICGMPSRSGNREGASTSDNVGSILYRNGWSESESRAKDTEKYFARSERDLLRVVLQICRNTIPDLKLELSDVEVNFARKSLSNMQSKIQGLIQLLENDYVHNHSAFQVFGDVFGDAEEAYRMGMEWHNQVHAEEETDIEAELENARKQAQQTTAVSDNAS